jgi:hypothetical protein
MEVAVGSEAIINLIIQLIVGAIGGNAAGAALKKFSLGPVGNTIAGVIGGGVGGQILNAILGGAAPVADMAAATGTTAAGGLDVATIIQQIVGGGVGGAILMIIVGVIKQMMGGAKHA